MLGRNDFEMMPGRKLIGQDGKKIGTIAELYADKEGGEATFATVNTGMFGTKTSFVPLHEASVSGEDVTVPYDQDLVKTAPQIDPDAEITPAEEQEIYRHYGLGGGMGSDVGGSYSDTDSYSDTTTTTGRGKVGNDVSGPETDEAMTRSEERLNVGTEQVETGRARLRKYITSENVTQTVPVTREEVRIDREPITDANRGNAMSGKDLSEEEHEVTLTEERPVVSKETVPVERVRLDKDTVTEQVQVDETVRKEQIEADGVYPDDASSSRTDKSNQNF